MTSTIHPSQRKSRHDAARDLRRVIRASELGQYAYCPKAWWLGGVLGVKSANTRDLHRGEVAHRLHGQHVWWAQALLVVAVVLAVLALIVFIGLLR